MPKIKSKDRTNSKENSNTTNTSTRTPTKSIRVSLTQNKGAKRPQAESTGLLKVPTTAKKLVEFCKSKLNLKCGGNSNSQKKIRIFVARHGNGELPAKPGTEIQLSNLEETQLDDTLDSSENNHNYIKLNQILCDGILLAVSTKDADYLDPAGGNPGKIGIASSSSDIENCLRKFACSSGPGGLGKSYPRWPERMDFLENVNDSTVEATTTQVVLVDSELEPEGGEDLVLENRDGEDINVNDTVVQTDADLSSSLSLRRDSVMTKLKAAVDDFRKDIRVSSEMCGIFPVFPTKKNLLPILKEVIKKEPKIQCLERDKDGIVVFDYADLPSKGESAMFNNSATDLNTGLLRECRGLVLCQKTGEVLARRFHKFFNLNEIEECNEERVQEKINKNFSNNLLVESDSENHNNTVYVLDKVDGALCSPVIVNIRGTTTTKIIWATRRSRSLEIENFIGTKYDEFVFAMMSSSSDSMNLTPLFEYCPLNRVVGVIRHKKEKLVLLGLRDNISGKYIDQELVAEVARCWGIEETALVHQKITSSSNVELDNESDIFQVSSVLDLVQKEDYFQSNQEGVVLAFQATGERYKIKSNWYVNMAATSKEGKGSGLGSKKNNNLSILLGKGQELASIPPETIWATVLRDDDDEIAGVVTQLRSSAMTIMSVPRKEDVDAFQTFLHLVRGGMAQLVGDIECWCREARELMEQKMEWGVNSTTKSEAAQSHCQSSKLNSSLVPISASEVVAAYAEKMAGWPVEITRAALNGHGTLCHALKNLFLGNFLQKYGNNGGVQKIERLLGIKWVSTARPQYVPDEILPASFDKHRIQTSHDALPGGDKARQHLKDHLFKHYLPRKIRNLTGDSNTNDHDPLSSLDLLHLPRVYAPDEGKIKGLWEQFASSYGIADLRIDLQNVNLRNGPNGHEGSREFGLLLIQHGIPKDKMGRWGDKDLKELLSKSNSSISNSLDTLTKGDLAGILIPTNCYVKYQHIEEAMRLSFERRRIVKMGVGRALLPSLVKAGLSASAVMGCYNKLESGGGSNSEKKEESACYREIKDEELKIGENLIAKIIDNDNINESSGNNVSTTNSPRDDQNLSCSTSSKFVNESEISKKSAKDKTKFNSQSRYSQTKTTIYRIFLDLDGVLADFDGGVKKMTGKCPNEFETVKDMWTEILGEGKNGSNTGFYRNLEWLDGGKKLFDEIQRIIKENREKFEINNDDSEEEESGQCTSTTQNSAVSTPRTATNHGKSPQEDKKTTVTVPGQSTNQKTKKISKRKAKLKLQQENYSKNQKGSTGNNYISTSSTDNTTNITDSDYSILQILTGLPSKSRHQCHLDKQHWCEQHLVPKVPVITCNSREKWKYCTKLQLGPNVTVKNILIDDTYAWKKTWMEAGGIFIHHYDVERTLFELRRVLGLGVTEESIELKESSVVTQDLEITRSSSGTNITSLKFIHGDQCQVDLASEEQEKCENSTESSSISIHVTELISTDDEWPNILEPSNNNKLIIGIDSEWVSGRTKGGHVSVLQIAVRNECGYIVYLFDWPNASSSLRRKLKSLLTNDAVLKVGFALQSDVNQLIVGTKNCSEDSSGLSVSEFSCFKPVVDLQEYYYSTVLNKNSSKSNNLPSFSDLINRVFNHKLDINKSKSLQDGDWGARPLSKEQLEYAAADAVLVLESYYRLKVNNIEDGGLKLFPPKCLFPNCTNSIVNSAQANANSKTQDQNDLPVQVLYTAVFLDQESQERLVSLTQTSDASEENLVQLHAGQNQNLHVTLWAADAQQSSASSLEHLKELPVGQTCKIVVQKKVRRLNKVIEGDDVTGSRSVVAVEAVKVVELDGSESMSSSRLTVFSGKPHITLAVRKGWKPKDALEIDYSDINHDISENGAEAKFDSDESDLVETIILQGIVGAVISGPYSQEHQLNNISSTVKQSIRESFSLLVDRLLFPISNIKVKQKIKDFSLSETSFNNEQLKLGQASSNPAESMTPGERRIVHLFAEKTGLIESRSEGSTSNNKIMVLVKKGWPSSELEKEKWMRKILQMNSNLAEDISDIDESSDNTGRLKIFKSGAEAVDERELQKRKHQAQTQIDKSINCRFKKTITDLPTFNGLNLKQFLADEKDKICNTVSGEVKPASESNAEDSIIVNSFPITWTYSEIDKTLTSPPGNVLLIILRGLPGLGKSTLAKRLQKYYYEYYESLGNNDSVSVTICSADQYFTEPGGMMTKKELRTLREKISSDPDDIDSEQLEAAVYRENFSADSRTLKAAHEYCELKFKRALEESEVHDKKNIVIIDNTNVQRWEYEESYVKSFCSLKYNNDSESKFVILELIAPTGRSSLEKRSIHDVPRDVVGKMRSRWEKDERAIRVVACSCQTDLTGSKAAAGTQSDDNLNSEIVSDYLPQCFDPEFEEQLLGSDTTIDQRPAACFTTNADSSLVDSLSLSAWLSSKRLIQNHSNKNSTNSKTTHLLMSPDGQNSSTCSGKFIHIPRKYRQEFLRRYVDAVNGGRESLFLAELRPEEGEKYRFYVDMDFKEGFSNQVDLKKLGDICWKTVYDDEKLTLVKSLEKNSESTKRMLLTAYLPNESDDSKLGIHLHFPDKIISTTDEALELRRKIIEALTMSNIESDKFDWPSIVDKDIYAEKHGGLRMLGSRKIGKKQGEDLGRVYRVGGFWHNDDVNIMASEVPRDLILTVEELELASLHCYDDDKSG